MSSFFVFVSFCFWHHCPRKSSRFGRIDVSNWTGGKVPQTIGSPQTLSSSGECE
jgi:hypothetical protein